MRNSLLTINLQEPVLLLRVFRDIDLVQSVIQTQLLHQAVHFVSIGRTCRVEVDLCFGSHRVNNSSGRSWTWLGSGRARAARRGKVRIQRGQTTNTCALIQI